MTEETQVTETKKPRPRLYKHNMGSAKYGFGILVSPDGKHENKSCNGKEAVFILGPGRVGRYFTTNPVEIALLDQEIALGHPNIFVDANEYELSEEAADPVSFMKAKIRAEVIAEMKRNELAATDPARDMGTSEQGKLNAANTSDVAPVAAGGSAVSLQARLVSLLPQSPSK